MAELLRIALELTGLRASRRPVSARRRASKSVIPAKSVPARRNAPNPPRPVSAKPARTVDPVRRSPRPTRRVGGFSMFLLACFCMAMGAWAGTSVQALAVSFVGHGPGAQAPQAYVVAETKVVF